MELNTGISGAAVFLSSQKVLLSEALHFVCTALLTVHNDYLKFLNEACALKLSFLKSSYMSC